MFPQRAEADTKVARRSGLSRVRAASQCRGAGGHWSRPR